MKMLWIAPVVAGVGLIGLIGSSAAAKDEPPHTLKAILDGFHQVPPVITEGTASFSGRINDDGTITYTLKYKNLTPGPATPPTRRGTSGSPIFTSAKSKILAASSCSFVGAAIRLRRQAKGSRL